MAAPRSLGEIGLQTVGEAIAFAAGFAAGRALEPIGVQLAQVAWEVAPIRAPDAGTLAAGVAQGQVNVDDARKWARQHGYDNKQFDALVSIANVGPPLGYAYQARRRGQLSPDEFTRAMHRAGIEPEWFPALRSLEAERLDLGAIATAIHRGIIPGPGLIIQEPPRTAGRVPVVPQSELSPTAEAAAHGIDAERLRVLVGNTGLPPGLIEMLRLLNMGHVTEDDVKRAVANSNLRNEYMDVVLGLRRRLLTPHEYVEANLRGWIDDAAMHAGTALSGMEAADADLLYKVQGRPIAVHQITTGLARGGKYGGDYAGVPEPYQAALRESNVRPEWGNLAYANRYTYPSAFVLRTLATTGELSPADVHQTLLEIGWRPDFAEKITKAWTGGTTAKADAHVKKAETSLFTALHRSYVAEESDVAAVTPGLTALGVTDHAAVLRLWDAERALIRAQLSPAQIKKAFEKLPAEWPRDRAIQALLSRGYSATEANTLLDE